MTVPISADAPTQQKYEVRFDWGTDGLTSVAPGVGAIVLVDALTFTTTVEVAVSHGLTVVPFDSSASLAHEEATALAAQHDAVLAAKRGEEGITMAPSSVTGEAVAAIAPASTLVLRSGNGAKLVARAAQFGVPVIAACLRNRTAVAQWILAHQEKLGQRSRVAIVAAGERREDGDPRFSVEDQLAVGAVIDALAEVGIDYSSPEAAVTGAAFGGLRRAVSHLYTASVSGQLLIESGYRDDVVLAARVDASTTVPVLADGRFVAG